MQLTALKPYLPASPAKFQPAAKIHFGSAGPDRNRRIDLHLGRTETAGFKQEFEATLNRAKLWLQEQKLKGQPGFVIFDIDETVLDNRGYFRDPQAQFYKKATGRKAIGEAWDRWVLQSASPVIEPSLKLIEWLQREKIPYCFLTGIAEKLQSASIANLKKVGAWKDNCLGAVYKPDNWQGSTTQFKKELRLKLEQKFNMPILASLGDRPGDMTDDPRKNFLLPSYVSALRRENDEG